MNDSFISEANKTVGIKMSPIKLEYGRYISNKLWNVFRFYMNYASEIEEEIKPIQPDESGINLIEQYMINKAEITAREIEKNMNELNVENSSQIAVQFLLNSVCDL